MLTQAKISKNNLVNRNLINTDFFRNSPHPFNMGAKTGFTPKDFSPFPNLPSARKYEESVLKQVPLYKPSPSPNVFPLF